MAMLLRHRARLRWFCGCVLLLQWMVPDCRAADAAAPAPPPAGPPESATPPITLPAVDDRLQELFAGKAVPASTDDLRSLEDRLRKVAAAVLPCTVGVQVGGGSGSGVIVSEDGFILTAGHVSGRPGQKVTIILQDGRRVPGWTLGANAGIDSGLIKIDGDEKWPHAELGTARGLPLGTWCVAAGHPGLEITSISGMMPCFAAIPSIAWTWLRRVSDFVRRDFWIPPGRWQDRRVPDGSRRNPSGISSCRHGWRVAG